MLLSSAKVPFTKEGWAHEPKLDGMRIIAVANSHHVRLFSRSGRDVTHIFPDVCAELKTIGSAVVLDGELIATDSNGRPDFDSLQQRWMLNRENDIRQSEMIAPTAFYAFDLLGLNSESLVKRPYQFRKELLYSSVAVGERLKVIRSFHDGARLFKTTGEQGLEGIVAKRLNSLYLPGTRSKDWVKIKHKQQTIVVLLAWNRDEGYLLGELRGGELTAVGFSKYGLTAMQSDRVTSLLKPGPALFDYRTNSLQWFKPTVWMNVEFMARTKTGALRFPVFKGIAGCALASD